MPNPGTLFNESLLIPLDFNHSDIVCIANECDRSVKVGFLPETEASYLGLILHLIDLTTLKPTDSQCTVEAVVDKALTFAKNSLKCDIEKIKSQCACEIYKYLIASSLTPATVCVSSKRVSDAMRRMNYLQQHIAITSVAGGYGLGQVPLSSQIAEVEYAIAHGASEIDVVIDLGIAITGDYQRLYNELRAVKCACFNGNITLKVILSVSELDCYQSAYQTAITAMMAGADFIQTSTGRETEVATLCYGVVMCYAIKTYHENTCYQVGFKLAGGVKFNEHAISWLLMIKNLLGNDWLQPCLFRIGACSMFDDLVQRLSCILKKFH